MILCKMFYSLKRFFTKGFVKKGLKFCIASLITCLLNFGINIIGHECFGVNVNILYPVALATVSLTAFLLCRFFIYPKAAERNVKLQIGQFVLSSIFFRICEWGLFYFLYNVIALTFHWWYVCCIFLVQVIGALSKFVFYNFYIFGHGDIGVVNDQKEVE